MNAALTAILFGLPCLAADAPGVSARTILTHDLGTLTYPQALALAGKLGRFRLTVDSLPDEYAGRTLYDCASGDATARTVWLCPGQAVEEGEALTVEGTLRILHHPAAAGAEGTMFPAFWEYRLVDAVRVE